MVSHAQLVDAGILRCFGTDAELAVLAHLDAVEDEPLAVAGLFKQHGRVTGTIDGTVDMEFVAVACRQGDEGNHHQE